VLLTTLSKRIKKTRKSKDKSVMLSRIEMMRNVMIVKGIEEILS